MIARPEGSGGNETMTKQAQLKAPASVWKRWASFLTALLLVLAVKTKPAAGDTGHGRDRDDPTEETAGQTEAMQKLDTDREDEQGTPETDNPFLTLGTEEGVGGENFMKYDRGRIKEQILQFIPPLMQPAFTGHAFVLPPGTWRISTSARFTNIGGDDFFMAGEPNLATFGDFEVTRRFIDLDFFYGLDFNRRFLHGFTVRVNVPYLDSSTQGAVHPNGVPFISLMASGSTQTIGDIGAFLKKKLLDQGNAPFGLAVAGAVSFPTGRNDEKFGNDGHILARRPDPDGDGVQPSFGAMIAALGGPQNFFNGAWKVPASVVESAPQILTPFPFNAGVFGRFSGDGRLPSVLQPGSGSFGSTVGAFLTRQFDPGQFGALGRFPGRSAFHAGLLYQINRPTDGVDRGDKTTFFTTFVKPVYRDYVAADFTVVGFHQQTDSYEGMIPEPEVVEDPTSGARMFYFALVPRPPFTSGTTLMVAPSAIISPNPQLRFTVSGLFRVVSPDLGPAPPFVLRLGLDVTF
jgi:hypothetical protein